MNSNLQNKLSQFQTAPPAGVWDKIAEALDAEQTFPQRLYDYEQQPKAAVWNKIAVALEEDMPAKVVPFTTRYRKPVQYVAVASVLALVFFTGSLLMKKTEATSVETAKSTDNPVQQQTIIQPSNQLAPQTNISLTKTTPAQTHYETVSTQFKKSYKRILGLVEPQNIISSVAVSGRFIPDEVNKEEMFDYSSLNDYMVYSDGDGNAIRLPKKLFSLVNCPDGDGSCKERIHQLQQKLSSNTLNADFGGVLEMLRQLQ